MIDVFYSYAVALCLVVLGIITERAFKIIEKSRQSVLFKKLLIALLVYSVMDFLWGVLGIGLLPNSRILYLLVSYGVYATSALVAWSWLRYSIVFFNLTDKQKLPIKFIADIILIALWSLLVSNIFFNEIFYVTPSGEYVCSNLREIYFYIQYINYILMIVLSVFEMSKNKAFTSKSDYYIAIVYSTIPLLSGILQQNYFEMPLYSSGFMISALSIYCFTVTDEKERYLVKSKEIEALKQSEAVMKNDLFLINTVAGNFDLICSINIIDNTIKCYRSGGILQKYVVMDDNNFIIYNDFDNIFKRIIADDEFETFLKSVNREKLMIKLQDGNIVREYFKATVSDERYDYCISFVMNSNDNNHVFVACKNITDEIRERKEKEDAIKKANYDGLTGLLNRVSFSERVNDYLEEKSSDKCGFIFIDMDHFKNINDTYGHSKGDLVLKYVADMLKMSFHADELISRMGGDEFCVFIPGIPQNIFEDRIKILINNTNNIYHEGYDADDISISVGGIYSNVSGVGYEEMKDFADKIMYEVKSNGRKGYKIEVIE